MHPAKTTSQARCVHAVEPLATRESHSAPGGTNYACIERLASNRPQRCRDASPVRKGRKAAPPPD